MTRVCASCGYSMVPDDRFCRQCGTPAPAGASVASATPPLHSGPTETSGKAIISLVCGLLFFVPFSFIAAIVFGHLGLSEIRRSAGRLKGEGMAIAGLVLGYIWIAGIPIFLIIAAIAIPNLLRARMAANEASAVSSIHSINVAEVSYNAAHPDVGFTCSLSDLAGENLIKANLARGELTGYRFELSGCTPGSQATAIAKYQVVAYPTVRNQTGRRAFCSDDSAVLKVDAEGSGQGCLENGSALE